MTGALPARPRPEPTPESAPYWEGLREHRLLVQRCARCGTPRLYPRPMCAACFSMEREWQAIEGRGTVHSWTVAHHAFHPGFKDALPYVIVTANLGDGIRLAAPLVADHDIELAPGMAVVIDYLDVDAELTLPRFRLAAKA